MAREISNIEEQDIRDTSSDITNMLIRDGLVTNNQGNFDDSYELIYNYLLHILENE